MVSYQPYDAAPAQPSPPALDMPHYGIGFIDAIKRGFKKYATFSGRAGRSEYWWWALFTFIVSVVLLVPAMYSVSRPHRMAAALLAPQLYR